MSQFGEHLDIDRWTAGLQHGYACEVGAYDGIQMSTTLELELRGWDVLCIEANPLLGPSLTMHRRSAMLCACGKENAEQQDFHIYEVTEGNVSAVSALKPDPNRPVHQDAEAKKTIKVPVRTLDWCLTQRAFPKLDVLSIDVEGGESDVLDGFSIARWHPRLIMLEDWIGGRHLERMTQAGYRLDVRRGPNEVYVRG